MRGKCRKEIMRILLFDAGSYTYRDLKEALERKEHRVTTLYYHFADRYRDEFFDERIRYELSKDSYDAVISVNFFPLLAVACHECGIRYISWSYDSPLDFRLSEYFDLDTNTVYLFDRAEVEKYRRQGYSNVYHLPLAINTERILQNLSNNREHGTYRADISFVGSLYNSELDALLLPVDDYIKGFVEALFQAQLRIYGCNILEQSISDKLIDRINSEYARIGQDKVRLTVRGLAYAIAKHITHTERCFLINELSGLYDVHLYTTDVCNMSQTVNVHGPVKYYDDMNLVFATSKLNLCPTLRSIESGIPLRALDILGAGGVLFSNYQLELAEYFEDGIECIMYGSLEEAFDKADYYLKNSDLLRKIAEKGNRKVADLFAYDERVDSLLS